MLRAIKRTAKASTLGVTSLKGLAQDVSRYPLGRFVGERSQVRRRYWKASCHHEPHFWMCNGAVDALVQLKATGGG